MALKTLAEQFAPLIGGRYTGQPGILWHQLDLSWGQDSVLDVTMLGMERIEDHGNYVLRSCLYDALQEAIDQRDHVRLLVLCDQAEEAGVDSELCDLTRQAIRVQYEGFAK